MFSCICKSTYLRDLIGHYSTLRRTNFTMKQSIISMPDIYHPPRQPGEFSSKIFPERNLQSKFYRFISQISIPLKCIARITVNRQQQPFFAILLDLEFLHSRPFSILSIMKNIVCTQSAQILLELLHISDLTIFCRYLINHFLNGLFEPDLVLRSLLGFGQSLPEQGNSSIFVHYFCISMPSVLKVFAQSEIQPIPPFKKLLLL